MLLDAIINKLNSTFDNIDIYDEEIKQGFEEPCFFIQQLMKNRKKEVDSNKYENNFDIQYFLEDHTADINRKYEEMAYKVFDLLEYIDLECGKKLRCNSIESEIIDGVLHIYVRYPFYLYNVKTDEKMQDVNVKGSAKDD